ncbi:MAG TPA: ROK family protein [Chitinophagaceae bacterium]|nr:ROK family protein [Chitinophagaceae bacterium]
MQNSVVGIDLGGTNIRVAVVTENKIQAMQTSRIDAAGSYDSILQTVYAVTDTVVTSSVAAIGIGVPSVVDLDTGVVYDVQNIPAWTEVPLKKLMEERYRIPVFVNNDANCFALGEAYFGQGKEATSIIGVTLGTGLGAGIIINRKLYAGSNCGAGEFGMVPYLDKFIEWYASGQFFFNQYGRRGDEVYAAAKAGDAQALAMYETFGFHLGHALKTIMYTYDPSLVIFGGSVRHAYELFQKPMWQQLQTLVFPRSVARLQIKCSTLQNSGVLGAAALYYNAL